VQVRTPGVPSPFRTNSRRVNLALTRKLSTRMKAVANDRLSYEEQLKVGTTQGGNRGVVSANGATTAKTGALRDYESVTRSLVAEVERVLALDLYDPGRAGAIAALTVDAKAWVGNYAPGGSCKKESGRAFNNALNQLISHFAFNGLAPLPKNTLEKVNRNITDTKALLDAGR
jgi:Photosystem II Pbs27